MLDELYAVLEQRARNRPQGSYTAELLDAGQAEIARKLNEECLEVILAAEGESDQRLAAEAGDLLYHLLVLLVARGVPLHAVWDELGERRGDGNHEGTKTTKRTE